LGKFYGKEMILYGAENIRCLKRQENIEVNEKENGKLLNKIRLDSKNKFYNSS
jgi:hypothetical protein